MTREELESLAGINVSRETFTRLEGFSAEFHHWANRINLVAPSTMNDFWRRHVADSLQLLSLHPSARYWVDLGSGGGFPGMIIAIALHEVRDSRVTLIESNRKKCGFLQLAKAKYAPETTVLAERIEVAVPQLDPPEIVTARALADLELLLDLTAPWLKKDTVGLFMKGRGYEAEIEKSRANWNFDLVRYDSRTASDAAVLQVSKLRSVQS